MKFIATEFSLVYRESVEDYSKEPYGHSILILAELEKSENVLVANGSDRTYLQHPIKLNITFCPNVFDESNYEADSFSPQRHIKIIRDFDGFFNFYARYDLGENNFSTLRESLMAKPEVLSITLTPEWDSDAGSPVLENFVDYEGNMVIWNIDERDWVNIMEINITEKNKMNKSYI